MLFQNVPSHSTSTMDSKENSKGLQQLQTFEINQEQYTSPYFISYPSSITLFTSKSHYVLENTKRVLYVPSEGYYDVPRHEEHSFENYSDSSSDVDCDSSDEEVSLDDEKTKNKIEVLAAMVGVDTKEPAVVLTEVVRLLKRLKRE